MMEDSSAYPMLFAEGCIGRLRLRNRVVMAPIDSVIRTEDGASTPAHRDYMAARARGGVALIIADNSIIRWPEGSVGAKSLRIDQDRFIPSLGEMVDEVHRYGGLIAAQINHAGRQTTLGGSQGLPLVSASDVAWDGSGTVPRELTAEELTRVVDDFRAAAIRCAKAGFDAVEIHASHGYLLSSFLSPALNHRTDAYGGSTENRVRLTQEVIWSVQDALPELPILVRMNCLDGIPGGIDQDESVEIAVRLAATGIDALDITAGTYESSALTFPPMMYPEGHIMARIGKIREAVDIPVIGVGRVVRPAAAEGFLRDGSVDYVALGRALIADPEWTNKAMAGRADEVRHCIGCNHGCIHRIDHDLSMRCNVNPDLGHEGRNRKPKATRALRILVAGAGPAGIEFSLRAVASGHDVHLYEESSEVGGQLVMAGIPDFKHDLATLRSYYKRQLELSSIDLSLNTAVTRAIVEEERPDLVIVATGAVPMQFAGESMADGPGVTTFDHVLDGDAELSESVVVIGGGPNGCETAVFLAQHGHSVTLLEMKDELVADEDHSIKIWVADTFKELGVTAHTRAKVTSIAAGTVSYISQSSTEEMNVSAGSVVLANGMRPRRPLVDELHGIARVEIIGDAYRSASILEATERAAWLAERLAREDVLV